MGWKSGSDLPPGLDAVEVGAVEGAGEQPELREAEAVGLLDGRIPDVDGRLGAVDLLLPHRRVRDRVLHTRSNSRKLIGCNGPVLPAAASGMDG